MRIVAVADTHCYERHLGALPDGDVFVHAGDLLQRGTIDELCQAAEWLRALPHAHKLVVAGNHDWCFQRAPVVAARALAGAATYLEDAGTTIEGVSFWGSPWQPEFFGWAFNLRRGAALREKWSRIPAGLDVLITHGPPRGIGDLVQGDHAGCDDLLAAIAERRPRLHLFGHIHEAGGFWQRGDTAFANVTTAECERGATVLDLDVARGQITAVDVPAASPR